MARYIRTPQDKDEEYLINRGWTMIGLGGWNHPTTGLRYFTKEQALTFDMSDYHPIEREHSEMLNLLKSIAEDGYGDDRESAYELLVKLGYHNVR